MNHYTVGWHGYEDSERIVLEHYNTFSQEEFTQIVEAVALVIAVCEARCAEPDTRRTTYEEIFPQVVEILTSVLGFRAQTYQAEHYTFSSGSLFNPQDDHWHRGEELNRITARLNEMGYGPECDPRPTWEQEYAKQSEESQ